MPPADAINGVPTENSRITLYQVIARNATQDAGGSDLWPPASGHPVAAANGCGHCPHKKEARLFIRTGLLIGTSMGTRTPVFAVRGRRLNRLTMEAHVAAEPGFEPGLNESESFVLPLHNSASPTGHDAVPNQRKLLYPLRAEKSRGFSKFIYNLRSSTGA